MHLFLKLFSVQIILLVCCFSLNLQSVEGNHIFQAKRQLSPEMKFPSQPILKKPQLKSNNRLLILFKRQIVNIDNFARINQAEMSREVADMVDKENNREKYDKGFMKVVCFLFFLLCTCFCTSTFSKCKKAFSCCCCRQKNEDERALV